jgi:3-isopropylmalate/(R)-2-methylmalate dehydratase large subunit
VYNIYLNNPFYYLVSIIMSKGTLYDKIWDAHKVADLPDGKTQIYVARHLMHEITSAQAFDIIREKDYAVRRRELTFAVADHVIPTKNSARPFTDENSELMIKTLENNAEEHGIDYFSMGLGKHGICHVTFPEQGIILPGQIIACGDSHTCTYGAFGSIAFGIGTTQVAQVLATQTLSVNKLKVRRINFNGTLNDAVTAKDLALYMIKSLGADGGIGYIYEFDGEAIDRMSMDSRMTLCNMAVEAGALSGYINPDDTTFEYLEKKPHCSGKNLKDKLFKDAINHWKSFSSDKDAEYDDSVNIDVSKIFPMVTWGTKSDMAIGINENLPLRDIDMSEDFKDAYHYMELSPGSRITGTPVDIVFIGSCTNGRLSDLVEASKILYGRKVSVKTLIVPGSQKVKSDAESLGLDKIFIDAGAEWRMPGCSMCIAMNPDKLSGCERCASTSNRNFRGRQGSPNGRTHLMSPLMAAATAIEGRIADPRKYI